MGIQNRRQINEKRFPDWEDLPGGRRYFLDVKGRQGWKARYVKEVDINEDTILWDGPNFKNIYSER